MTSERIDESTDDGGPPGGTSDDSRDSGKKSPLERSPPTCLSFTVAGPWAHFRRIEGNVVKQTYRIIPRTTVAGLVAAMLGITRDGYYDLFAPGESAVAIEPTRRLRTMNMPMNTLSTANEDMLSLNSRGSISVRLPDPSKHRQQHNYQVLVDPAYRIDLWLAYEERYEALRSSLANGRSYYVPSLGLSEHLAEVEYHGEFEVEQRSNEEEVIVESAVPGSSERVVPTPGVNWQMEQSPAFMAADEGGRTTTSFTTYAFTPDPDEQSGLAVQGADVSVVDDRTVMFV